MASFFYRELLTDIFKQYIEFGKVESKGYILIYDIKTGFYRIHELSKSRAKKLEKKLAGEGRSFEVYIVKNIRGFVCLERKYYVNGKLEEWKVEAFNEDCKAVLTWKGKRNIVVDDDPKGCLKKYRIFWSNFVKE